MKVTVMPIVIVALSTVTKGFAQGLEDLEIRGRVETIQTTLLRSVRILIRVLETWGDLLFLQTPVENHQLTLVWKFLIIIIIIIWSPQNDNTHKSNLLLIKKEKRTCYLVNFVTQCKKRKQKMKKYFDQRILKTTVDNCNLNCWYVWNNP